MALYALDEASNVVFARDADPLARYRCMECRGLVARRTGLHRRPHFCHLRNAPGCRLHSKSIDHLVLQTELQKTIPGLEMERPFPSILRIADLLWEREKIVFEIQCSPIVPAEVIARRRDYLGEGYDLVWLLDDRLFNRKKLRISEDLLRKEAGYFFSLRNAAVYDQFEVIVASTRLGIGPRLPVDLSRPVKVSSKAFPLRQLKERNSKRCFQGDLVDRTLQSSTYLQRLIEYERSLLERQLKPRMNWLKRGLQKLLEYLLRKTASENENL